MKQNILSIAIGFLVCFNLIAGYRVFADDLGIKPKNKVAEDSKPELIPEITFPQTLSPNPKPVFKTGTKEDYQESQKIPVYLPHNGKTYYCDPAGTDAIKDASGMIVKKQEEKTDCDNEVMASVKECLEDCKKQAVQLEARCSMESPTYNACVLSSIQYGKSCTESCRNLITACPTISQSRYDDLNSLLSTYCNP